MRYRRILLMSLVVLPLWLAGQPLPPALTIADLDLPACLAWSGEQVLSPAPVAALQAAFERAAREADATITSGGVSVGEADHTKAMMRQLARSAPDGTGGGVVFWRIAMRPGRPMAVGRIGHKPLFGLPGNPVAVMVTFLALCARRCGR